MAAKSGNPKYTSMKKHVDPEGMFSIWVSGDWHRIGMAEGHRGVIYSPYPDDINTSFMVEHHRLDTSVRPKDLTVLRNGFLAGIQQLPDAEIEKFEASVGEAGAILLDATFTFSQDGVRRKRWVRISYWGTGQLTFVAQGSTVEEFDYWLPMFYNTMMTVEV